MSESQIDGSSKRGVAFRSKDKGLLVPPTPKVYGTSANPYTPPRPQASEANPHAKAVGKAALYPSQTHESRPHPPPLPLPPIWPETRISPDPWDDVAPKPPEATSSSTNRGGQLWR